MNIAKKSVKFSFDFSNAQISPMTINGCGRYNLENVTIPLVGYTLSMDGDTFDGHCDGEISFTYLDIDDILEKLKIVGTDSYFDQEYEHIRQRIIQEGRQRYGDDFDEYEDAERSELNDFELNYSSLTQRMWDNLKLDIKSAKLSKFTLTGKWSSWDDSPDVDEWKEGIKGSLTVDITDADGNTYRDIKVKFDESTAFIFGEEAFDYMESAIYTANEKDDGYMANTKKSRPIRKENGDDYFVSRLTSDLKQRLDRDAGIIVRDVVPRDGGYDVTLDFYTKDKSIVDLGYYLGKYFKRVTPIGNSTYHCIDEMISERDWYGDAPVSKTKMLSKNDTVKSMMKSKDDKMKKNTQDLEKYFWCLEDVTDGLYTAIKVIRDDMTGYIPQRHFAILDDMIRHLVEYIHVVEDMAEEVQLQLNGVKIASTKKSKSMKKGKIDNRINKSFTLGDLDTLNVTYETLIKLYNEFWDNAPDNYEDDEEFTLYVAVEDAIQNAEHVVGDYIDYLSNPKYSASTKKSKREILKAKVDELLEEDDDEIAKPRMKDMFLDSKRKSRKSTKSNNEKGEDADEYREESDGDDVSDSKVMKPEEANDNEDENEAPSSGNSSLPEDADGQENQSAKRKKRMSKFSVTTGGSQPYNGRQNYNQSPMMREAIDRFKAEKDLVKSLQNRVDEINGARKNTEVNNKSPLRIKGRY